MRNLQEFNWSNSVSGGLSSFIVIGLITPNILSLYTVIDPIYRYVAEIL